MAEQQRRRAVLTPVATPTSVDHAVSQLRDVIVTGGMRPGERLVETDLAERLGLSRGPIREALRQLGREGLVTIRPNRGAVVSAVQAEDVVEVYALRATLGTMALRNLMGTNRSTPELAERLERLAARCRACRSSQRRLVAADLEFQSLIADSSGLPRVARLFEELTSEIRLFISVLGIRYRDVDTILDEHASLVAAIRSGDTELAETIWRDRFARAVREFVELIPHAEHTIERLPWLAIGAPDPDTDPDAP